MAKEHEENYTIEHIEVALAAFITESQRAGVDIKKVGSIAQTGIIKGDSGYYKVNDNDHAVISATILKNAISSVINKL
ncbi:hypothetical protein [Photobacterium leiognathi]|uniref:hypothetical protein n=1 Tax=Photobacterium leiognathi TaxID=553611 RepID=UPI002738D52E|nr:hypothetical protein [Photobacterium leiognathi]